MRTGIYVYSSTTLTFTSSEPLVMAWYGHPDTAISTTTWTCTATPGIYKFTTHTSISVSGVGDITVVAEPNDKNPFPEPPPRALSVFGVTQTQVDAFFAK